MFLLDILRFIFESILTLTVIGLVLVSGSLLTLVAINLIEIVAGRPWRRPAIAAMPSDADLPHVLVQIPFFNEFDMVEGAVRTAAALDWPQDKLHIQLLDDSSDETTAIAEAVAADLRAKGFDILHVRRVDRSGFKAGALSVGLSETDMPFVAMLDVDFRPPRDWLRTVVPILLADPTAGFAQSRCEFANYRTNWLTRAQGLMLDTHFVLEQATRYRAGWLFQFNGTGGVWRRAAIEAAGGWSADSLCEDLDLTVRAELAGWHGVFVMEPAVPGLVPERVRHWRVQQRRWSNGFVQVAHKLMRPIWSSNLAFGKKLSASVLILIQAVYPCVALAVVSFLFCLLLRAGNPEAYIPLLRLFGLLILAVAFGMTFVPYMILRRGSIWRYLATLGLVVPLMVYVSVSNTPSIVQTALGRREHFKRTPKSRPAAPH